jgi:hypothetical protein
MNGERQSVEVVCLRLVGALFIAWLLLFLHSQSVAQLLSYMRGARFMKKGTKY